MINGKDYKEWETRIRSDSIMVLNLSLYQEKNPWEQFYLQWHSSVYANLYMQTINQTLLGQTII